MNLTKFEAEFSNLRNLFSKKGFYKEPDKEEIDVFGKFLSYHSEVEIITSRLEKEIADFISHQKYFMECMKKGRKINRIKTEEFGMVFAKIILDLSDFYIYTRRFLDTLTVCIKLSFRSADNKKWNEMKNSVKHLYGKKMETYKAEIDSHFFEGLEQKVSWIRDFKDSRDKLLHNFAHFVFTSTREGDLGYDIMDKTKESWGTDTVRGILVELQNIIDNLSDLMEYLSKNLPKTP